MSEPTLRELEAQGVIPPPGGRSHHGDDIAHSLEHHGEPLTEEEIRELQEEARYRRRPALVLDINLDHLEDVSPDGKPIRIVVNGLAYDGELKLIGNMITLRMTDGVMILRTNRSQLDALKRIEPDRIIGS